MTYRLSRAVNTHSVKYRKTENRLQNYWCSMDRRLFSQLQRRSQCWAQEL